MTRFDFHVHTGLSACAENIMSPKQILLKAKEHSINFIAITDHNAIANVETSMILGERLGVKVIPGVEVGTSEDIHLIALFEKLTALQDFQDFIDRHLPDEENLPDLFGHQLIYDVDGEITDLDTQMRQIGISADINQVVERIKLGGGYVVPAHVLRAKFSIKSQLGFIPRGERFDALELSYRDWVRGNYVPGSKLEGYPVITGSDSHFLENVGRTFMEIPQDASTLSGIFKAISELV